MKNSNYIIFFILLVVFIIGCKRITPQKNQYVDYIFDTLSKEQKFTQIHIPDKGVLQTPQAACDVAYAILRNIYGKEIDNEIPFKITLINDSIWELKGSEKDNNEVPYVFHLRMRKSDGQVLLLIHD